MKATGGRCVTIRFLIIHAALEEALNVSHLLNIERNVRKAVVTYQEMAEPSVLKVGTVTLPLL